MSVSDSRALPDQLLRPEAWPTPRPASVELIETHVSWVFRGEREVVKVKKPVNLGFLDFRSIERRRMACEDEVRLNARLAPGKYLGIVPIAQGSDGALHIGGEGRVVDWGVHMQRLADGLRADAMLARGELTEKRVDDLAETIARFHAHAEVPLETALRFASPEAVERNMRENFAQTRALSEGLSAELGLDRIESWQASFLRGHAPLLAKRASAGRARDGHGDLRL